MYLVRKKTDWLARLCMCLPPWLIVVEACRVQYDTSTYVRISPRLGYKPL